ncbi:ABC transporter ATP-binding protein [Periweissella cryptocerci]|uniref:ABC transporter ATP-binding protein n=1 Tax=Periweissella cryptocerci TaxID=2506420 RepID=A0A4P6YRC2_9LACO|nr:ABC transporter ATP-binding protein [Periweissella cryptocerci]QBO35170.1 ABC transporter ATP-binding protein [Periweissella cryptocerci]
MTTIIEVKRIEKSFGKFQALKDVDLQVDTGEILALIGPSGSGKSTLVKAIMGMLTVDSGSVRVFAQTMPNRNLLNRLGYMAQNDALYPTLTGRENLNFFGELTGLTKDRLKQRIEEVATVVKLNQHLDKKTGSYSGGMLRRLSLAIALLAEPELLILDEPTVGIDPELRQQIWLELHRLASLGTAILLTTHVMEDALESDQVLMLRNGATISRGTPTELMTRNHVDNLDAVFIVAGQVQDSTTGGLA